MPDLSGLLVVALEQFVAAPYATARLADAGARVIKIERPEGDVARSLDRHVAGQASYFVWLNRGKESVMLDLTRPRDRDLLARMVAKADVFIQNLAPGAAARLGFECGDLRRRHPRLITCSISGYGEEGPLKDLKAYDLLVQAESGLAGITGGPEAPGRSGVSVCDIATGMNACQAILQALIGRARTGEGREIAVSLYHSMADWMNVPYLQYAYGGAAPARVGLRHPTIAPYGLFACADGKALLISVQSDREWAALCRLIARPDLVDDPRFRANVDRVRNRPQTDAFVAAWFAGRPRDAALAMLAEARIAYGRLSDLDDVKAHPQNRFVTVATEAGDVTMMAPAAIVAGATSQLGPVPALGQHSDAIRREFAG